MTAIGAPVIQNKEVVFRTCALTKTYAMGEVKVQALRGIDSELYAGELVVLLGASGSGKSTYLNILGGLDRPTTGEVWYRDQDLTHATEAALTEYRRYHVGFVFQFYNLIPSLTALEVVITHNMSIGSMAERVIHLSDGLISSIDVNESRVPASSLFRDDDGWVVYVVNNDRAESRSVEPGQRSGISTQVLSGLAVGDQVINHPGDDLQTGSRVRSR